MAQRTAAAPDTGRVAVEHEAPPRRWHGGRVLAETLRRNGVEVLFTLGGGHIVEVLDGCVDAGIRVIDVRHEGAATLAAEGWALSTGRTAAAAVEAGPGFTNALTGFTDAAVWNVPLLLIGGRTGFDLAGRGAVMDVDQRAMVQPVARWTATCTRAETIAPLTREALMRARLGRPGAAYLEIPHDLLRARVEPLPDGAGPGAPVPARVRAPADDVDRAAWLLARAERPLIVAGGGAFWSGAGDAVERLCDSARIPVTTTSAARGLVADSHPWCIGSLVHGGAALLSADVVLVLGSAFNANLLYGGPPLFSDTQTVIQVDIDAPQLGGNRTPDVALCGDVASVCDDLATALGEGTADRSAWLEEARSATRLSLAMWDQQVDSHDGRLIHPGTVAREIAAFAREDLREGATFVADGGDTLTWALAYLQAEGPGRMLFTTTALGTLGVGMPFAVAAAVARPGEPVILMSGDGAFGLSAMEIDTAVRHRLPIISVVANNGGWADVRHHQTEVFGREVASSLTFARYDRMAQALGAHGEHVRRAADLRGALRRSLESGLPSVVNVETDPEVMSALLRMMVRMGIM